MEWWQFILGAVAVIAFLRLAGWITTIIAILFAIDAVRDGAGAERYALIFVCWLIAFTFLTGRGGGLANSINGETERVRSEQQRRAREARFR